VADPSRTFQQLLTTLRDAAKADGDAALSGAAPTWFLPPDWPGDPFDPDGFAAAFQREDLNAAVEEALNGDAPMAELAGYKLQIDYIATLERAFRMRHASPAALAAMAAARRRGHGRDGGVFVGGVLRYVQDVLAAGGRPPEEAPT
jgi:hypothetical protein